jgi:hypothetical protein
MPGRRACGNERLCLSYLETLMKTVSALLLAMTLCSGIYLTGCETSHSESDKPGLFGGNKHEETTTTKNPITGDTNTTHSEQTTNP